MSDKEARRVYVIEQLIKEKITVKQAAVLLGLSDRQIKRLKKGVQEKGVGFLAHGNRGRKPKHAIDENTRDLILTLATGKLRDASSEHIAELLFELHGIKVSPRTTRRVLAQAGIRLHKRKVCRKRRSRERMAQEGLLVQGDASPYTWFEERGPKASLHGFIDDATGKVLALYFRPQEDLLGYFQVLSQMVLDYGIPQSLYTDRHSIFFSPKKDKLSIEEELAGKTVALTQFGKALDELGINHIAARSPEAKGRIERLWRTLQSRLVVELRLHNICSIDEANAFLPGFIDRFNRRFAVEPADPVSAFAPAPTKDVLNRIIAYRDERRATKGSTISYLGRTYQLIDARGQAVALTPRSKVVVLTHLDGSISAVNQNKYYGLRVFNPPKAKPETTVSKTPPKPAIPAPDHPWRHMSIKPPYSNEPVEDYFRRWEHRHFGSL